MIIELKMYGVQCENCGEYWIDEDSGVCGYADELGMKSQIGEDDSWHVEKLKGEADKHYCPKCFGGFDDDDKLIIKSSFKS